MANMFEGINLISPNESEELFGKQNYLMTRYFETGDDYYFLQLALLQILSPISDYSVARTILMRNMASESFELLAIGAYISAEDYECADNYFLSRLFEEYGRFTTFQKSVIHYIHALQSHNKKTSLQQETIKSLDKSIELCGDYTSNYYLRYVITRDNNDLIEAKKNVARIITDKEVSLLSTDELILPDAFIDEHILMTCMISSTFDALFNVAGH